jgi:hypothetical protein
MRQKILLSMVILLLATVGRSQAKKFCMAYKVDPSVKDSFSLWAQKSDPATRDFIHTGYAAIVVPDVMGGQAVPQKKDSLVTFNMPCSCSFNKDTLGVTVTLGYEGGSAYMALITAKGFSTEYMIYARMPDFSKNKKEWTREIYVPTISGKLTVSKTWPYKRDELLFGIYEFQTQPFYQRAGNAIKQRYEKVRIYFSCIVP